MRLSRPQRTIQELKTQPKAISRFPPLLVAYVVLLPITLWAISHFYSGSGEGGGGGPLLLRVDTATATDHGSGRGTTTIVKKNNQLANRKAPNCGKKGSRTLVMLMGELECGEVAWESLYRHVLDVNCADLALLIPKEEAMAKAKTSSLLKRAKYVWKYDDYNDWGDAWDTIDKNWRQKIEITSEALQGGAFGGIKGYPGSGAKWNMLRYWLREHLLNDGVVKKYDRFVLSTPGQYYVCDFNINSLSPHWVWVPQGWGNFLVASDTNIADSLDVIPTMLKHFKQEEDESWAGAHTMERQWALTWSTKKLPTDSTRRFFYSCRDSSHDPPPVLESDKVSFTRAYETCPESGLAPDTIELDSSQEQGSGDDDADDDGEGGSESSDESEEGEEGGN